MKTFHVATLLALLSTLALLAPLPSCSSKTSSSLPPLGEVVIVVDTDVPLAFAERLRVDVLENGAWIESRDLLRPSVDSWPASFSVYSPDAAGRVATVRLRVYPEGRTRDYHGERFVPRRPTLFAAGERASIPGDETPRLLRDGIDVTPVQEPVPLATIDRLVRVRVTAGQQGMARVVLAGECLGTMADVAHQMTCLDRDGALVPVTDQTIEPLGPPPKSLLGTFPGSRPCEVAARPESNGSDGRPLREEEACVRGGAFFFGVPYAEGLIEDEGVGIPAVLAPFLIDKWEVTVGRLRRAVSQGFVITAGDPRRNDQPFVRDPTVTPFDSLDLCSYSTKPLGREDYAVTCISLETARDFCRFFGGDLPTEAQWYYAAVVAERPAQTPYPWGEESASCDHAVVARVAGISGYCSDVAFGPAPVDAAPADASIGLGLIGMHGGVTEWTRDQFHHLFEGCWYAATLHDPSCEDPSARLQAVGGVSWREASVTHDRRRSWSRTLRANHVGFRCVRSAVVDP